MRNVRLHSSGLYEARIQIQGTRWTAYGSTEEEAARLLEEKVLRSQRLRDSYSLKQWMEEQYLPSIAKTSKAHQEKAKWAISHLGRLGDRPLEMVDRAALQSLLNSKALSAESLKGLRRHYMAALNLAEADDVIPRNPMRYVKLKRQIPTAKRVLTAPELLRLIDHTRGYAGHAAAVLGGLMGLRLGEIQALRPEHFQKQGKLLIPGTKTHASVREMPLHPQVLAEIANMTFPLEGAGGATREALKRAVFRAQMDVHVHPHLLRHTFASLLEWLGCPLDVRGRLLGHGKKSVTEGYSHAAWNGWVYWLGELVEFVYQSGGEQVGYGPQEKAPKT